MLDTTSITAADALTESLETMAFISALPPEDALAPAGLAFFTRIEFRGASDGALELLCSREFGHLLAANLLGCAPDDPDLAQRAGDALKELINITCGTFLRNTGATARALVEMSVPVQSAFDLADWDAFVAANATILDAEGHKLALRLVEIK